jgi:acetate kinase
MKKILVINAGSATLKFKIFNVSSLKLEKEGIVERIGIKDSFLKIGKQEINWSKGLSNHYLALVEVLKVLENDLAEIKLVGHRVVHGGEKFNKPTLLNTKVVKELEKYNQLAPLHNPVGLACIKKALDLLQQARQYAVFDTAYFTTLPEHAYRYALPEELYRKYGIRRYGFHGLSHQSSAVEGAKKIGQPLGKLKIITCHLGSGCSMTATLNGKAVATSLGFTPLEGLMMSTRSGDLDPGVVLFLLDQGLSAEKISEILNKKSGLLGVAGTMDMREILFSAGEKVVGYKSSKKTIAPAKAKLALKMFVYNIVRYVGQYHAIMKGVDLLVFTGGIGERSPAVRRLVVKELSALGKFKSVVISANEELAIAKAISEK